MKFVLVFSLVGLLYCSRHFLGFVRSHCYLMLLYRHQRLLHFFDESCDWPMPWFALLLSLLSSSSSLPFPPLCNAALFPSCSWFWTPRLLHDIKVPVPETQIPNWVEACDQPIPWLTDLPCAKTSSVIERGPIKSMNEIVNAIVVITALFVNDLLFI